MVETTLAGLPVRELAAKDSCRITSCVLGLLILGLAWVARLALDPVLGEAQAFSTAFVAVAVAAWWFGWRVAVPVLIAGLRGQRLVFRSSKTLAGNWRTGSTLPSW